MINIIKTLLISSVILFSSSCSITTKPSISTMEILNDRLSNIENEIKVKPKVNIKINNKKDSLTEPQKEFIKFMMDYLGD